MSPTPPLERSLEDFFRKRVRLVGGMTVKLAPTEAGMPDRLVIMPGGRIYLIELKTDAGQLSPVQLAWHRRARACGGRVHTVHGVDGIVNWLRYAAGTVDVKKRRPYVRKSA